MRKLHDSLESLGIQFYNSSRISILDPKFYSEKRVFVDPLHKAALLKGVDKLPLTTSSSDDSDSRKGFR